MIETSASLLERLRQANNDEAWRRFVDLYTPLLYKWALPLGAQPSDAADLVQDIFQTLIRKLPEFHYDKRQSFRAWLRTVMLNKWRDNCRRNARQPVVEQRDVETVAVADPVDAFSEVEYRRYLMGRVLQYLEAEFPEPTWRAFHELVISGKPAQEVAARFHLSLNALYLIRSRVLRRLREELAGLLD